MNDSKIKQEMDLAGARFLILNSDTGKICIRTNHMLRISENIEGLHLKGRTGRTTVEIDDFPPIGITGIFSKVRAAVLAYVTLK